MEYLGQSTEDDDSLSINYLYSKQVNFQDSLKQRVVFNGQFYKVIDTLVKDYFQGSWNYFYLKRAEENSDEIELVNLILLPIKVEYYNGKFRFITNSPIFLNNCLLIRGKSYYEVPDIKYPIF